jgi:FkbH-like protein
MTNYITSNFNLLFNNQNWSNLKKKFKLDVDNKYNNFFLSLNDSYIFNKYNNFHVIIYLDNTNVTETLKKIKNLNSKIKNSKNKFFFFYLFFKKNNDLKRNNELIITTTSLIRSQQNNLKENLFIEFYNDLNDNYFSLRNYTYLKFPFDLKVINFLNKKIKNNITIIEAKPYKLIVLDCDNTLWGGILDESGFRDIKYGEDGDGIIFKNFQKKLKILKEKGFILSISSKNTEKNVWLAMEKRQMILQKKDFINSKINWSEKNLNLKKILKELSLREADTVFIDDNILEIKKVKKFLKKINTIHFEDPVIGLEKINKDKRFQKIRVLDEDIRKYNQYKIKSKFEEQKPFNIISKDFYKNLKQKINIVNCNNTNFNRALQLFNKTNQFNFCLNRYTEVNFKKINKSKNHNIILFDFNDKFGDHGIIGSCILKKNNKNIEIIDLALSCRVFSRFIEDFIIYHIVSNYKAKSYLINYLKTDTNKELIPTFLKKSYFKFIKKKRKIMIYQIKKNKELHDIKNYFRK